MRKVVKSGLKSVYFASIRGFGISVIRLEQDKISIKENSQFSNMKIKRSGGQMEQFIEIEILKFDSLIKRKDIKSPQWFAMEYDILTHPDFFDITGDEFKVYVWVIGVATKLNANKIRVYPKLCAHQLRIKEKDVLLTIEKLTGKRFHVTDPLRTRTESVRTRTATVQDRTVQDSTRQDSTVQGLSKVSSNLPEQIFNLWNEACQKLPKAKTLSKKRIAQISARLKETPDLEDWSEAIFAMTQSDFCNGASDSGWVATFDFLLQPDSITKALEGKYSNRASTKKTKSEKTMENLANLWEENERGLLGE